MISRVPVTEFRLSQWHNVDFGFACESLQSVAVLVSSGFEDGGTARLYLQNIGKIFHVLCKQQRAESTSTEFPISIHPSACRLVARNDRTRTRIHRSYNLL
jgi:hypothetical protein